MHSTLVGGKQRAAQQWMSRPQNPIGKDLLAIRIPYIYIYIYDNIYIYI